MSDTSLTSAFRAAVVVSMAALGLLFAPPSITGPLRTGVRVAVRPGQQWAGMAVAQAAETRGILRNAARRNTRLDRLQAELRSWRTRCRRLQAEVARLNERQAQIKARGVSPYQTTPGEPLLVSELLDASVLGVESGMQRIFEQASPRLLLDRGSVEDVTKSDLVLQGPAVIDQGRANGLEAGQPAYAGRSVAGRVAESGRHTSLLQPVTDSGYRGLAQLARETSQGLVFGARGIIEGTGGRSCRLKFVEATEAVSVGDAVYTGDRDGVLPYPMYYGEVVEAKLEPGAAHWTIRVEPAVDVETLRSVQVLRRKPNPARLDGSELLTAEDAEARRGVRR